MAMENLERLRGSKHIFVAGIGGATGASRAVFGAVRPSFFCSVGDLPKMHFIDFLTERDAGELYSYVRDKVASKEELAFFVVSKSGQTTETAQSFEKILGILEQKFGKAGDRSVVISEEGTPLFERGMEAGFFCVKWPDGVDGRFSAFEVPQTLPLAAALVDVEEYLRGRERMDEGHIFRLSNLIFENYANDVKILDIFIFDRRLEDVGLWTRQLFAESLGKEDDRGGREGITPTVTIAPRDMHSMLQLYLGGPKDRYTLFVKTESDNDFIRSLESNVIRAYEKANLPHYVYDMGEIREGAIGKLFAELMALVAELGKKMGVDINTEEEVEKYKARFNIN
jgi:glucose-6-phosphate isomerase